MNRTEFRGTARLDRRTKRLVKRLGVGDVAIIDHAELDRVSAEELVASGVRIVVNVSPSVSERYPNPGPLELVRAGVHLVDAPGAPLFEQIREGDVVSVRDASVYRNGMRLASGHELTRELLERLLAEQNGRVTEALESFADNTMRYLREEGRLLTEGVELPAVAHALPRPPRARRRPRPRATSAISRSSATTSASSDPCWSASTEEPTRSSRPATARI